MKTFRIKRVYDEPAEEDGYRIFVDRLWPRGVRKDELSFDIWAKELAPSTELRRWYHADIDGRWEEFAERYQRELADGHAADSVRGEIGTANTVTLLYGAKDPEHNHAIVLADYLRNHF